MTTTFDPDKSASAVLDYNRFGRELDVVTPFAAALVVIRRYDRPRVSWGVHLLTCDTTFRGFPRFHTDVVGLASTQQVYATLATGRFGLDLLPDLELARRTDFGRLGAHMVTEFVRYQVLPLEFQCPGDEGKVPWHRVWMFGVEHMFRFDPRAAAAMGSHYAETWSQQAWHREREHHLG